VVDRLSPRTAEPLDLSTVLAAVEGRVVCPANNQLCMFDLILLDNEVLTLTLGCRPHTHTALFSSLNTLRLTQPSTK